MPSGCPWASSAVMTVTPVTKEPKQRRNSIGSSAGKTAWVSIVTVMVKKRKRWTVRYGSKSSIVDDVGNELSRLPLAPETLDRHGLLACKHEERNTFHVAQIIAFCAR
jgi:hypothetical protein